MDAETRAGVSHSGPSGIFATLPWVDPRREPRRIETSPKTGSQGKTRTRNRPRGQQTNRKKDKPNEKTAKHHRTATAGAKDWDTRITESEAYPSLPNDGDSVPCAKGLRRAQTRNVT